MSQQNLEPEILAAIQNGQKINAIKMLRESRGLDLKEAKEIVDQVSLELNPSGNEETFGSNKSGSCLPLFLGMGLLPILLYFIIQ